MLEILKKHGFSAGIASLVVLAITFVPIYYQYKYTREQNARIEALEAKVASLPK
jgi:hypothetical protein